MKQKTAILFLCHFITNSMIERYRKLVADVGTKYDVYWVFQSDNELSSEPLLQQGFSVFEFDLDNLNDLNYSPIYERLYGSEHFITEFFSHQKPEYEYVWVIEYDVVFSGHWNTFFSAFAESKADLLSSHIEIRDESNWEWTWWKTLSFTEEDQIKESQYIKSFNPVYRISKQALDFLDIYLKKEENKGFYEVILPTPLFHHGFQLVDFGGTGKFVPSPFRNRFYVQGKGINNGTMRWRPEFSMEEIEALGVKDKLFHPVKE